MKYLLNLIIGLLVTTMAYSQDTLQKTTISINVGVNNFINKDEFQSPYIYKGTSPIFRFAYAKTGARSQHLIDLTYAPGKMKSTVSPEADNQLFSLKYDYLFRINAGKPDSKFRFYAGPGVYGFLSNTNYFPDIEQPKSNQSTSVNLLLSGKASYQFNAKSSLILQAGISAIGMVHRPNFEVYGDQLTNLTFIGKNNLALVKLAYNYQLTPKWSGSLNYNYSYFSYQEPKPVTILQNSLQLGLRYKIR